MEYNEKKIIKEVVKILNNKSTMEKYKIGDKSFLRNRKLGFKSLTLLLLSKSIKSIQNRLNEFFDKISDSCETVTSSAFTQARKKLSHMLFIDLNSEVILKEFYASKNYRKFKGHRLIGIDGSRLYLPNSKDIRREFPSIPVKVKDPDRFDYVGGMASVAYDLLNNIAIDSIMTNHKVGERDLALLHLNKLSKGDLVIMDRGYPSYELAASCIKHEVDFLFRCSKSWIKEIRDMFNSNEVDKIITLKKTRIRGAKQDLDLPEEIKMRLVKVILDDGEIEILATSLLDDKIYKTNDFKILYWKRWGIETFFGVLKGRLNLENFSGKTAESVKQDFYSTIFISNLETILTDDANTLLEEKNKRNKNDLKVNKAVSFNVLKNNLFQLLYTGTDIDKLLKKLTQLFIKSPTSIRPGRGFVRKKDCPRRALHYHKRVKKSVY